MSIHQHRGEVHRVIAEIEKCLHRPLFDEIKSGVVKPDICDLVGKGKGKRRKIIESVGWDKLLLRASNILQFMTPKEHGTLSNLASVLLLGYVQHRSPKYYEPSRVRAQISGGGQGSSLKAIGRDISHVNLGELLECSLYLYSAHGILSLGGSTEQQASSFRHFLRSGLAPFLAGRPAHAQNTCLVELLALIIFPNNFPSDDSIRRSPLMYNLSYADKRETVRIISEHLSLPYCRISLSGEATEPLFSEALPRLFSSLKNFSSTALSSEDSLLALTAMTNIVLHSGNFFDEQFNVLITTITDACVSCCSPAHSQCRSESDEKSCFLGGVGSLLRILVSMQRLKNTLALRSDGFDQSDQSTDGEDANISRTKGTTCKLADAIACLLQKSAPGNGQHHVRFLSCKLKALLNASVPIFRCTTDDVGRNPSEERMKAVELVENKRLVASAVGLLSYPSIQVVMASSRLLSLAFAGATELYDPEVAKKFYAVVKRAFVNQGKDETLSRSSDANDKQRSETLYSIVYGLLPLLSTISRLSSSFANALCTLLLSPNNKADDKAPCNIETLRALSTIALSQPQIVAKYRKKIESLISRRDEGLKSFGSAMRNMTEETVHLISVMLPCHGILPSVEESRDSLLRIDSNVEKIRDAWTLYKLGRLALGTGCFDVASGIYARLKRWDFLSCETTYLWLDVLSRTAAAESLVRKEGILGMHDAICMFSAAKSTLSSLSRSHISREGFSFQQRILSLRIDFLELCISACGLSRELNLAGPTSLRQTRSHLHQANMSACFFALARRYRTLYDVHGPFICQQSKTAIRSLSSICFFVSKLVSSCFSEEFFSSSRDASKMGDWPAGDKCHPIIRLTHALDERVVKLMNDAVGSPVRAFVLSEILNSLLMSSSPFPKDFLKANSLESVQLRVSVDPLDLVRIDMDGQDDDNIPRDNSFSNHAEVIDVPFGFSCNLYVSGKLPALYMSRKVSITSVYAGYTLTYDGPVLTEDSAVDAGIENEFDETEKGVPTESAEKFGAQVIGGGKFLINLECTPIEKFGYYRVDIGIGCRDIYGNKWQVPTVTSSCVIYLCVIGSKNENSLI